MRILKIVSGYPMKRVKTTSHLMILDYSLFDNTPNHGYLTPGDILSSKGGRYSPYGQKL